MRKRQSTYFSDWSVQGTDGSVGVGVQLPVGAKVQNPVVRGGKYLCADFVEECMQRRSVLGMLGLGLTGGVAGCSSAQSRPSVELDSTVGITHPATESYIVDGLAANGDNRVFTQVTGDAAPELVGPDATHPVNNRLRGRGHEDQFHLIVQLRSTPDAPLVLWPMRHREVPDRVELRDDSTLVAQVDVYSDIHRNERIHGELPEAEELVHTSVWSLTPTIDPLPEDVRLQLATRD